MSHDLLIKDGLVVDGSGQSGVRANVAVKDGRIVAIGNENGRADRTIDAEGHIVSPGFIDGHTHMDAQVFWDKLGSCSCYHGVTSVVMGNCGFTLAPCKESEADLVFRNLERAEDISRDAMLEGIKWQWETYPEYMDAVAATPKGINYAGYVGHSALRTYVMGPRAFEETATEDEMQTMANIVQEAVKKGAIGFSTSRTRNHETADRRPVASRLAAWDEVKFIVTKMRETGAGIFEIASEDTGRHPERLQDYQNRLKELAVDHGVPVTFGMFSSRRAPEYWRAFLDFVQTVNAEGGTMFTQVHSRALNVILSFETRTPFDSWEVWRDIRRLPKADQISKFKDPAIKHKLVEVASHPSERHKAIGAEVRPPDWHWTYLLDEPSGGSQRMDELASAKGISPVELMLDLAVESDFKVMFRQPIANEIDSEVIELMRTPNTVCTFSDSGAHVSQIMDSSLQTHLFKHWVRAEQELTVEEAVRMVTSVPASRWGLKNRGLLREGYAADIAIFDPDRIGPDMPEVVHDLPSGARRLKQVAHGIKNTIVNGEVFLENNEHTGSQSGQFLRGPLAN
ncbi:MAG: amidohydrolase family protein [Gammaproteobacteria bacterium]|nr:amidohydrolase family protein [Gammaproteobacteria bacterium]